MEDPLLPPDERAVGPIYRELIHSSHPHPTALSAQIAKYLITVLGKNEVTGAPCATISNLSALNSLVLCATQIFAGHRLANLHTPTLVFFILSALLELLLVVLLAKQPRNKKSLYFEVSSRRPTKKNTDDTLSFSRLRWFPMFRR